MGRSKIRKDDIQRRFFCDKHRIKFIIHNLISNAVKYMRRNKGHCWLHISVMVDVEIFEDISVGAPEQYQRKVFDMFYRASELSQGAGLGSYIVKKTASKLNGEIRLDSKDSHGTRFTLPLPNVYKRMSRPDLEHKLLILYTARIHAVRTIPG